MINLCSHEVPASCIFIVFFFKALRKIDWFNHMRVIVSPLMHVTVTLFFFRLFDRFICFSHHQWKKRKKKTREITTMPISMKIMIVNCERTLGNIAWNKNMKSSKTQLTFFFRSFSSLFIVSCVWKKAQREKNKTKLYTPRSLIIVLLFRVSTIFSVHPFSVRCPTFVVICNCFRFEFESRLFQLLTSCVCNNQIYFPKKQS